MTNVIAQVIAALLVVESGNRPHAVGDGGRAVGCLQMHAVAVAEANRLAGRRRWTPADRRCPRESIAMCRLTLAHHFRRGVTDPVALACRWRNPSGDAPVWYRERLARALRHPPAGAPSPEGSAAGMKRWRWVFHFDNLQWAQCDETEGDV